MKIDIGPGLLRLILATLVVVEHLSRFKVGLVSVMVFFALSGYWVSLIFDRGFFQHPRGTVVFYLSRFLRIWPLFFLVALFATAVLFWTNGRVSGEIWPAFMLLGVASHGIDLIKVSWTLDIELQFYLLLPFLFLLWTHEKIPSLAQLVILVLLWLLGLGILRLIGVHSFLLYVPIFAAGAAIYISNITVGRRLATLSLFAFVAFGIAAALHPLTHSFVIYGTDSLLNDRMFAQAWAFLLLPFIVYNVRRPSDSLDRHLGNLSYPVYLVHFPIILIARHLLGGEISDGLKPLVLLFSFAVALALYIFVDRWIERRRHIMVQKLMQQTRDV